MFGSDNENLLNATKTQKTQAITKIFQVRLNATKTATKIAKTHTLEIVRVTCLRTN